MFCVSVLVPCLWGLFPGSWKTVGVEKELVASGVEDAENEFGRGEGPRSVNWLENENEVDKKSELVVRTNSRVTRSTDSQCSC